MYETTDNATLTELGRRLIGGSLSDQAIQRATEATPNFAILPWVNVVKIGGQSIMDRGRSAVGPVVEEIVANLHRHKMILGTGAGTRARHVYSLAIDLGLQGSGLVGSRLGRRGEPVALALHAVALAARLAGRE